MAVRAEPVEEERSRALRWAVGGGVLLVVLLVAWLLFSAGSGYTVNATFQNSSQLVSGNDVRLGGVRIGSVKALELADDGRARVEMEIDGDHSPLEEGTRAVIRQTSLSGIANRFVDLQLPRGDTGGEIDDGGEIPADDTIAAVELDSLFNTLDEETRESLQGVIGGFSRQFEGKGDEAREGFRFLAPALATTREVLGELAADTAVLDRFVLDSARLVTAASERREDLAALVGNLSETTRAASADQAALAEALERLPDFMRRANTTFVNLRAALDDVDPLVSASKPAARRLRRFLPELRSFTAGAEPAVRDLSRTIRDPGADDDLIELLRTFPPLADIAVETRERNGARRPGAFPAIAEGLERGAPIIGFGRPYTVDFFGWLDDFSHTGGYDAIGGYSRTTAYFNLLSADVGGEPLPIGPQQQGSEFLRIARTRQFRRCPGHGDVAAPDGSNVYTPEEAQAFDCDPTHRGAGNR